MAGAMMSNFTEAIRLTGDIATVVAALYHSFVFVAVGLPIVACAWLSGLTRRELGSTKGGRYSIGLPSISCRYRSGAFCEA
jgi:hypothetical protein